LREIETFSKVQGRPITTSEIGDKIKAILGLGEEK
jgi:hypothetical protein